VLLLLLKVFLRFTLHKVIIVLFFFVFFFFSPSLFPHFFVRPSLFISKIIFCVRDQNVCGSTGIDIDRRPHEGGPA